MEVEEGLYDAPHNEDGVERSSMRIRMMGRIVGAACMEVAFSQEGMAKKEK